MGISDILRKNDEKKAHHGDPRLGAYDRGISARATFSETVAATAIAVLTGFHDPALGEITRLPIASKSTETGVYVECQGMVRLTLHCVVRADPNGIAYCSPIELAMSRGGRIVRGTFAPVRGNSGGRTNKLGVTEKEFAIDPPRLLSAIESLAHQL